MDDLARPASVRRRFDPWAALALLTLLIASLGAVALSVHYQHMQMDRDEAIHARDGQLFAHAFSQGGTGPVLDLLRRPQWSPPAHGLLLATWFNAFGSSVLAARLYSAACFVLLILVTWWWAVELGGKQHGRKLALLPVLLLVTDTAHVTSATIAMLEIPAALWSALAFLLDARAENQPGRRKLWLVAASAGAALIAFMTRYSFGLPLLAALGIAHLVRIARAGAKRIPLRQALAPAAVFAVPTVLLLAGWLLAWGQLAPMLEYSRAQPINVERWSLANFVYYPVASLTLGPLSALASIAFVYALVKTRLMNLRPSQFAILAFLALAFVELFFVRAKSIRFGMLLFVPLWVVTSSLLVQFIPARVWTRRSRVVAAALGFVGLCIVGVVAGLQIGHAYPQHYENLNDGIHRAYLDIERVVRPWTRSETSIVLFGERDQWPGTALEFNLVAACSAHRVPCDVHVVDGRELRLRARNGSGKDYAAHLAEALKAADFVVTYRDASRLGSAVASRPRLLEAEYPCELMARRDGKLRSLTAHVTVHGPSTLSQALGQADRP